jgi:hypothetical protein
MMEQSLHKHEARPVDSRVAKRAEKPKQGTAASNLLDLLMKSKKVHEITKWDGIKMSEDRAQLVRPCREAGFDEWHPELDRKYFE